jgi:dephospho-CoA kinase
MFRLGLTGGIGSGKSTVSARLAHHGAIVIDYDQLARDAVALGTQALAAIAERFGDGVIAPDGTLDRPALGTVVFGDDAARADLEAITHPAIWDLAIELEATVPDDGVVVHDHPLLVEMGMAAFCDLVVVVDVPEDVQVERMVSLRGMTEADARARMAAQASREERLAEADVVLENTDSIADLEARVDELWALRVRPKHT